MQSSTAIAIRALVMLIVLISVPLFAIFGKNLPDVVKGLLEGRGLVLGPAPGAEANPPLASPKPEANNPFAQSGPYRAAPEAGNPSASAGASLIPSSNPAMVGMGAPASGIVPGSSASLAGSLNPLAGPGGASLNGGTQNMPGSTVAGQIPTMQPAAEPNQFVSSAGPLSLAGSPPPSAPRAPTNSSGAQPASFLAAPEATALAPSEPASRDFNRSGLPANSPEESPYASKNNPIRDPAGQGALGTSDEKFRRAEMRLRELGATHYMLETWGPDNNRYRFVCKMAIGGNAEVNRYFQAIDDNPWQAMETVLRQVEDWRARPLPQ
jgi:hypothetical protein